mgnify:CR=1 FL=1
MVHQPATLEQAKQLGLLEEEFHKICDILGRHPNFTEISISTLLDLITDTLYNSK